MLSTIIFISLISFGSVYMDSNLKEFCAKKYFHSFVTKGKTALQLNRKVDSNEMSYHSWVLPFQENPKILNTTQIKYTLNAGQILKSIRTELGDCAIDMTVKGFIGYKSMLTNVVIINDIKGAKLKYYRPVVRNQTKTDTNITTYYEEVETQLLSPGFWLTGLLCKASDKTLYAIIEEKTSINDSNRTQLLSRIHIQKNPDIQEKDLFDRTVEHRNVINLSIDSKRETVNQFLGIDCSKILNPNIESEPCVSTDTLFVIVLVLMLSGVILSTINTILIIKRKRQKPSMSFDTRFEKTIQTSISSVQQTTPYV